MPSASSCARYIAMLKDATPAICACAIVAMEAQTVDIADVAMNGNRSVPSPHWADECHCLQQQMSIVFDDLKRCRIDLVPTVTMHQNTMRVNN